MNLFDNFDRILANFNKMEEPFFLRDIIDFAEKNREVVIKTYSVLLKNLNLNIQLKYLILKPMGELKFKEFVPIIRETLPTETKVQIIFEAINTLNVIGSFSAYKVLVNFYLKHEKSDMAEKIERALRDLFTRNPLAFHFDVFYRQRGALTGIDKSSTFLVQHLPDQFIPELLPAVHSKFFTIRFETIRLLKERPNPAFYTNIFNYFKEHYAAIDANFFLMLSEALVNNGIISRAKTQIYEKLKEFVPLLEGEKKKLFCVSLLKMNNRELIHYIAASYPHLDYEQKMLVLDHLNPEEYLYYNDFMRQLLVMENNEELLSRIVEILIRANEIPFVFDTVKTAKGLRKTLLLSMILELGPTNIESHILHFVKPSQDNRVLKLSIEYLMKNAADNNFETVKTIFFSGVSREVKVLIMRSANRWSPLNRKFFMEAVLNDLSAIDGFRKDFLFSLLGVLNERVFDIDFEEKILNRILVMMEESPQEEIVNFIYFFDKYDINRIQDQELIIDELRLVQNTLLKSSNDQNLVKMIHILIKNLEKKKILKRL